MQTDDTRDRVIVKIQVAPFVIATLPYFLLHKLRVQVSLDAAHRRYSATLGMRPPSRGVSAWILEIGSLGPVLAL